MANKKGAGRPAKLLTNKEIAEIESLAVGLTIKQIAEYFEMSESVFSKLKAKNINIKTAYDKYKAKTLGKAYGILWNIIESGTNQSFPAVKFYIETQGGIGKKENDFTIGAGNVGKLVIDFTDVKKDNDKPTNN